MTNKLSKNQMYAIEVVANLLRGRKPEGDVILLDDCAISATDANTIIALADSCIPNFDRDAKPFPDDEL